MSWTREPAEPATQPNRWAGASGDDSVVDEPGDIPPAGEEQADSKPASPRELPSSDYLATELAAGTFNVLKVPDVDVGTAASGAFLEGGLAQGQRVALVSFEQPDRLLGRLAENVGIELRPQLESERLVYLYYRPDVTRRFSLASDYRALFDEVEALSEGAIDRLVLCGFEALLNVESRYLIHTSLHRLAAAVNASQMTTLAYFVDTGVERQWLDGACSSMFSTYYTLR